MTTHCTWSFMAIVSQHWLHFLVRPAEYFQEICKLQFNSYKAPKDRHKLICADLCLLQAIGRIFKITAKDETNKHCTVWRGKLIPAICKILVNFLWLAHYNNLGRGGKELYIYPKSKTNSAKAGTSFGNVSLVLLHNGLTLQ